MDSKLTKEELEAWMPRSEREAKQRLHEMMARLGALVVSLPQISHDVITARGEDPECSPAVHFSDCAATEMIELFVTLTAVASISPMCAGIVHTGLISTFQTAMEIGGLVGEEPPPEMFTKRYDGKVH